jgi:hypothetical protein
MKTVVEDILADYRSAGFLGGFHLMSCTVLRFGDPLLWACGLRKSRVRDIRYIELNRYAVERNSGSPARDEPLVCYRSIRPLPALGAGHTTEG